MRGMFLLVSQLALEPSVLTRLSCSSLFFVLNSGTSLPTAHVTGADYPHSHISSLVEGLIFMLVPHQTLDMGQKCCSFR